MSAFIEKIKVSNFLSFFGEHEVNLKPFSAIMCNFYEGKDDLLRAFEFVFGAKLTDLRVENPLELVHTALRGEFLVNHDIHTYVEITLGQVQEKKQLKFSRGVKHGENYLLEDWKKVNKEIKYLKELKSRAAEKHYNSMKTSHSVIAKYTKKYETLRKNREIKICEILQDFSNNSSSENTPSVEKPDEDDDFEERKQDILKLEAEIHFLTEKFDELKLKEASLTSYLYHEEIKLACKPVNASVLQNRISHIKTQIQEKENLISEIWKEMCVVESNIDNINRKIPYAVIALQEIQNKSDRLNRFTKYGKFCDYLQPSRYIHLLQHVLGDDIFCSHLCDSVEEAFFLLKQLKDLKYEHREVFLPFEHYSHKLKDIITASGERGIQISTLEELLIFLCKLKHYRLIDEVPVIVQKDYSFENATPEEYTIYVRNNIHFTSEGPFSRKTDENDFSMESEKDWRKNLAQFYMEEEVNYRKLDDLLFVKWETLTHLNSLVNDVFYLKQNWRRSVQKPPVVQQSSPITQIYEEFSDIFKEHAEAIEEYECELQQEEESFVEERNSVTSSDEESVNFIMKNLEDVILEKRKTEKNLNDVTHELRRISTVPAYGCSLRRSSVKFQNDLDKAKLFFEKEFRKLKHLIREDDLEDFLASEEWRKAFISSLIKDFHEIKVKLKAASEVLLDISTARKTKLYRLFDHCSRYLSNTFTHILNDALPFVKLDFGYGEEKIHLMSCLEKERINVIDIKHFNTFLKFISAFALFLEIAVFENTPLMIIEDIEEYFPPHNDNLEAVIESSALEKILPDNENPRFSLLMRLGQFLNHYIRKNTSEKFIRNNGNNTGYVNGPRQIIYFAKEDFVHAAEHYIWIQNQILPEECITENCNSYSEIHEITLENLNF